MKAEHRRLFDGFDPDQYLIRENLSFASLTSFRTGGTAAFAVSPKTPEAFGKLICRLTERGEDYLLLGHGTNVLAPDEGYAGVLVLTDQLNELKITGTVLSAQAGVLLHTAAIAAQKAALSGLEFAYGIPGSVGGGLCMNAGAFEHSLGELDLRILSCDSAGRLLTLSCADCDFSYRNSIFLQKGYFALACEFHLKPGDADAIKAQMDAYLERRKQTQPLEYPSAGSFFKRPKGHFAGRLIEDAGLKGVRVGAAQVSEKHAGFLINLGGATTKDVTDLAALVQARVKEHSGVTLEREVRYLSDHD